MRVFYSDDHAVTLPPRHRFPMGKYRALREKLVAEAVVSEQELLRARLALREELVRAHDAAYVDAVLSGELDERRVRRIGFPWSPELVKRSLASVGGALAAADAALEDGVAGNLAGGTHHALFDAGEGFCVFNDLAVVSLCLLDSKRLARVAIVDLDVHQGNGNSAILGSRGDVFVFSMHGEKNFPFRKVPSTLDIALADGTGDAEYLERLSEALPRVFAFAPQIVLYQAGVDPLAEDRLGRLSLSAQGLAERDRLVLEGARRSGVPIALALGGGYSEPIELSVRAHVETYRVARRVFG
jgi:acetoin utilization deacetylase AcuC-like enzyme